uniref:Uncharacterized protein n=1 Tax=Rhizophora mucronata TaxID=61149 RepID=A0A2P2LBK3_RHIMU
MDLHSGQLFGTLGLWVRPLSSSFSVCV